MILIASLGIPDEDLDPPKQIPPHFHLEGSEEELVYRLNYQLLGVLALKYSLEKNTKMEDELDILLCKYRLKQLTPS